MCLINRTGSTEADETVSGDQRSSALTAGHCGSTDIECVYPVESDPPDFIDWSLLV